MPGVALCRGFESLSEIDLIAVAVANVFLHRAERSGITVAAEIRLWGPEHAKRRRLGQRLRRQARHERVPARERARVAPVADEPRPPSPVIDDDGPVIE